MDLACLRQPSVVYLTPSNCHDNVLALARRKFGVGAMHFGVSREMQWSDWESDFASYVPHSSFNIKLEALFPT